MVPGGCKPFARRDLEAGASADGEAGVAVEIADLLGRGIVCKLLVLVAALAGATRVALVDPDRRAVGLLTVVDDEALAGAPEVPDRAVRLEGEVLGLVAGGAAVKREIGVVSQDRRCCVMWCLRYGVVCGDVVCIVGIGWIVCCSLGVYCSAY